MDQLQACMHDFQHTCYHASMQLEVEPNGCLHIYLRSKVYLIGESGLYACMVHHKNAEDMQACGKQRFKLKMHSESYVPRKTKVSSMAAALYECFVFSSNQFLAMAGVCQLVAEMRSLLHSRHNLRDACAKCAHILLKKGKGGHQQMLQMARTL